jgi:phosphoadenosine phosphosulfate reductase
MSVPDLDLCIPQPGQVWSEAQLSAVNPCLERLGALERVQWALDYLPSQAVLTSSFGAQSAVMLHMMGRFENRVPVILIDTGYLFPETYRFIDQMQNRLGFDLEVYRPEFSRGWQEARHGEMWASGVDGIRRYNKMNKVEPMERALIDLQVGSWFSGLRRSQSDSRRGLKLLQRHGRAVKVHPIVDWTNQDVHRYLKKYDLPYHPLWDQGYVSIGDTHTSRPLVAGMDEQDTRFFGLLRECGLHEAGNFATQKS